MRIKRSVLLKREKHKKKAKIKRKEKRENHKIEKAEEGQFSEKQHRKTFKAPGGKRRTDSRSEKGALSRKND